MVARPPLPPPVVGEPRGRDILRGEPQGLEEGDLIRVGPARVVSPKYLPDLGLNVGAGDRALRDWPDDVARLDRRRRARIDKEPRSYHRLRVQLAPVRPGGPDRVDVGS